MPLRLKSLTLQGYKTFASRTEFQFSEQVTAIVGPNGSGKSNIADAVRWALGEQSLRLLRARTTADMIFSGSEQRPRAGMAAVTITFDNSDGWLPIDFTEVSITRRAYRDGQNEYLLNGQRVRLKDIRELLAGAGLAEQSYTIIGQGLVDAALSLKADERRTLFEEAAGIGLYRARREEALRRLETTRRNLERVQDILAELRPRLRSLERQARRAQEYEQVRADLRLLLREWYGYHWHRAQQELVEARRFFQAEEAALLQAREQNATLAERLTAARARLQSLREELNDVHRRLSDLHRQREALQRDLAVADERRRAMTAQRDQVTAEIARQEAAVQAQQERLQAAGERAAQLRTEHEEAVRQAEAARQALQQRRRQRAAVEQQLAEQRRELGRLRARQEHLHAQQAARRQQAERLEREMETARQALAQAEEAARQARRVLVEREQALTAAQQAEAEAVRALDEARQALHAQEAETRRLETEHAALQADLAGLQARLEVLQQAEQALEGYAEGARTLLQAIRQGQLPSGTAFGAAIQVPDELETAIAAALGPLADGVVFPDQQAVLQALHVLDGHPGRAALLHRQTAEPPAPLPPVQDPDCLGVAADHIGAPEAWRPLLHRLLGRVLLVRDRAAAARIRPQVPQARLVTLAGEVFEPDGVVLVGQGSGGSVIRRTRERRTLEARLTALQQAVADARQALGEANRTLESRRTAVAAAEQALDQARTLLRQAQAARQQAAAALDRATQQVEWHRKQIERAERSRREAQQEIARLEADAQATEDTITATQEALHTARQRLAALPLDEFQTALGHWETRLAVLEQALNDARARVTESRQALQAATGHLHTLQQRQAALEQALARQADDKTALREQDAALAARIAELEARAGPLEQGLQAAEAALDNLLHEESQARERLHRAERNHAQAQLNLTRCQEALDRLRERIEDDFGLVAFEYVETVEGPTPLPLDGMVEQLPVVTEISPDLETSLKRKRAQLRRMGAINPEARQEYQEVQQRYQFLTAQMDDLQRAEADIKEVIAELDRLMERDFRRTFEAVAHEFREIFTRLFGGGSARLVLTQPDDLTHTGIDIEARLPGRRTQGLALLSGGERSLTAAALVFALLRVSPTPFCVLDEVDAMLDEANVARFRDLLEELSRHTQFVVITHNRNTVQAADVIYGITMGRDSASQVISLKLDEVSEELTR